MSRDPREFHLRLPTYHGPRLQEPSWAWWPGVRDHWEAASSPRSRHSDGKIEAVIIHATAGSSSSGAMSVLKKHRSSWHFLIPDEDEQAHGNHHWDCIPERLAAWHVRSSIGHPDLQKGRRYINFWSVGIEVVNRQNREGEPDAFSDWQIERTADICRYLWSKHGVRDIISHAKIDPTRRSDPGAHFPWDAFTDRILKGPFPEENGTEIEQLPDPRFDVLGPDGALVECEPRTDDGVTVVNLRPIVEALGYRVEYLEDRRGTVARILPKEEG